MVYSFGIVNCVISRRGVLGGSLGLSVTLRLFYDISIKTWLDGAKAKREVVWSVRALHLHGVAYTDMRDANVLWNGETERAIMIDFE